jgi:hypothetical protein
MGQTPETTMSRKTDLAFGRQGGRFLPDDYEAIDFKNAPSCSVCGKPMILRQKGRHFVCSPLSTCCGYPTDLIQDLDRHARTHEEML